GEGMVRGRVSSSRALPCPRPSPRPPRTAFLVALPPWPPSPLFVQRVSLPYAARPPRRVRGATINAMADKPLTYGTYLRVPQLLDLQKSLSSPAHHDEALFIIIHQVYELWFKLILHEVDSAAAEIEGDHLYEGTRLLRGGLEIQRLLIRRVRILETMRPEDFLGFRYHLNPASGFQSIQFREVEFLLGLEEPVVVHRLVCEPLP